MKRVGIFTTFYEASSGYSLIAVTETQIRMLLDHGYDPVVLVQSNFECDKQLWQPETVDLRRCMPAFPLRNHVEADFDERADAVYAALVENLSDVGILITHDIILQEWYLEHNVALRRYAKERPDMLILNWIHSVPSSDGGKSKPPVDARYSPPPGYIIYPNDAHRNRVLATYKLQGQEKRVIVSRSAHSIDPLLVWNYDELTKDLVRRADLLSGDVVAVYPTRLDTGKQPEKLVRLAKGILDAGYLPRVLIIDWQSSGKHFQAYIDQMLRLAKSLGVDGMVNFTSRLNDSCSQGVPRHVVTELMDLSNIYVHPSLSETYSLVVHEAVLRGKLICLNYQLAPMREIYGEHGIYFDFSNDQFEPDEQTFWNDEARRLVSELRQNRALWAQTQARRLWTPQAMWPDFERLFYLEAVGE